MRFAIIGLILLAACADTNSVAHSDNLTFPKTNQKPIPFSGIQRGINLGNWLEAPAPGEWGVAILPEHFTHIRQVGFDGVRLPVRFCAHANPLPPYTLDEEFMRWVDDAVRNGLENGLNVILDFHHYDDLMADPAGHAERFLAIWEQLAERYQDAPDTLYFELLNEPYGGMDASTWNTLARRAVERIRANNPHRWIIIGGTNYNHIRALEDLKLPQDERLIATFHFYEPFEFTHQGAAWVAGSENWKGTIWKGTDQEKEEIIQLLDGAVRWSQEEGIPLLMGEFGAIIGADKNARLIWSDFVAREAGKRGIGWIYWDFCGEFGIFDCEKSEWDWLLLNSLKGK